MKNARLHDWEKQAIADAYVAGEKVEAVASKFKICVSHVRAVAKRMGAKLRRGCRPRKNGVDLKTSIDEMKLLG